jgi:hypothetical protein
LCSAAGFCSSDFFASPGLVLLVKASVLPSGDHAGLDAPPATSVIGRASPPSICSR